MKQKSLLKTIVYNISNNASDSPDYFRGIFPLYLHKKLRRLVEGLYLVTSHLSDTEPLKNIIRTEAIKIINLSVKIKGDKLSDTNNVLYEEIIINVASITSLLEVIAIAGMISEQNYYLISKELNTIFESLRDKLKDYPNPDGSLAASFFKIEIDGIDQQTGVIIKDNTIKDKEKNLDKDKTVLKNNNIEVQKIKQYTEENNNKNIYKKDNDKDRSKKILRTVEKLDREKTVLNFFKDNRKMTVKDISVLLPQYGEKTIQREILRLVANGILSKSGKKRWALYFSSENNRNS